MWCFSSGVLPLVILVDVDGVGEGEKKRRGEA
jgi:hypothetical protein